MAKVKGIARLGYGWRGEGGLGTYDRGDPEVGIVTDFCTTPLGSSVIFQRAEGMAEGRSIEVIGR